jgi:pyridoxamine 5'-phosphate oxidase
LEKAFADVEERYSGQEIPLPSHWGGYIVRPQAIEFWQECPSRLHDRILFTRDTQSWVARRLFP